MIGESIEEIIKARVDEVLKNKEMPELKNDIIQTDSLGEVIEKLIIVHIRCWMIEDAFIDASDEDIVSLKKKLDICFKDKRPKYVEAINRMIDNSIQDGKTLSEDSVKFYKGFEN